MASSLLLHLPPLPSHLFHGFQTSSQSNSISFQVRRNPNPRFKSPISTSSSSSNPSSSWEREEIRWLREEQRWIREEQRWLREESRWNSDREALLREIGTLKLQIEALEREKSTPSSPSISDTISNLASILQALKESEAKSKSEPRRIVESGSGAGRMLLEEGEVKEMVLEEIRVSESVEEVKKEEEKKRKVALRKGSEGEDVQAMQDALQKLGFYSGEEDMEYSSFSGGTERAVKGWQAGIPERFAPEKETGMEQSPPPNFSVYIPACSRQSSCSKKNRWNMPVAARTDKICSGLRRQFEFSLHAPAPPTHPEKNMKPKFFYECLENRNGLQFFSRRSSPWSWIEPKKLSGSTCIV